MRKLIIATALVLITGVAFGQILQKGYTVSVHTLTISLEPDVTMAQFVDYFNKSIPEWEKALPGLELLLMKGLNKENEDTYALIFVFESLKDFHKYWNDDGTFNVLNSVGKEAWEDFQIVLDEMHKLGTFEAEISDWVLQ
jgi:hypothetical protein